MNLFLIIKFIFGTISISMFDFIVRSCKSFLFPFLPPKFFLLRRIGWFFSGNLGRCLLTRKLKHGLTAFIICSVRWYFVESWLERGIWWRTIFRPLLVLEYEKRMKIQDKNITSLLMFTFNMCDYKICYTNLTY